MNYIIDEQGNRRPTKEITLLALNREHLCEKTANTGYDIYYFDDTGCLEVERNDFMMVFDTDEEAVEQAIKDGIKFIPIDELPDNFDRNYLGWIDTPENRKAIEEYCSDESEYYINGRSLWDDNGNYIGWGREVR